MARPWDVSHRIEQVIQFREERDWGQFHRPKELAAGLAIEAAELQELFLWRDGEVASEVLNDEGQTAKIREEIADITIFVLMLANDLGIDLEAAVGDKLAANARRYPVSEHRGRAEKASHG